MMDGMFDGYCFGTPTLGEYIFLFGILAFFVVTCL